MKKKMITYLVLFVGGIFTLSAQTQAANCNVHVDINTTSNCHLDQYLDCTGSCTQTRTYGCAGDCTGNKCCKQTGTFYGILGVNYNCGDYLGACSCFTSGTPFYGDTPTCGCV